MARTIYLDTARGVLDRRVDDYARMMGRRARPLEVTVSAAGPWLQLKLPTDGVHPWEFHNLAYWLLDIGTVVAVSGASPTHSGYHLVGADHPGELLEGWTDEGEPLTVDAPSNDVVLGDPEVPGPQTSTDEVLELARVPERGWVPLKALQVRSDDPGPNLNPTLRPTKRRRADLQPIYFDR